MTDPALTWPGFHGQLEGAARLLGRAHDLVTSQQGLECRELMAEEVADLHGQLTTVISGLEVRYGSATDDEPNRGAHASPSASEALRNAAVELYEALAPHIQRKPDAQKAPDPAISELLSELGQQVEGLMRRLEMGEPSREARQPPHPESAGRDVPVDLSDEDISQLRLIADQVADVYDRVREPSADQDEKGA